MGRGVSSGGGQSSLGYLFGSGEAPKPATTTSEAPKPTTNTSEVPKNQTESASNATPQKSAPASPPGVANKPAGVPGNNANNYFRADGQNCGNFLTDRPTTKVHAAPGGGSSLDYLFGGGEK
ncbi:hypothetical protein ACOSQ2_026331 [Xanthoceras sorbifolium]|uniref:Uncharacterized protein n=1 Tax=Xanthoceras sorbifolium TaxID=99658 RepID=A0ABQ8H5M3_9ROSI|nr:hypothetical protein JRO89_XS13G0002800 [Xanthoceras sorbifolium]